MTCVVGLKADGRVWVGGDAIGSDGYSRTQMASPKVFKLESHGMVIGYTSSFRMGQLLQYKLPLKLPKPPKQPGSLLPWVCGDFIDAVQACFRDAKYTTVKDQTEKGGTFILGVHGRLFRIENDFAVIESTDDYLACGCGENYALGALAALSSTVSRAAPPTVAQIIELAIGAAAHHCALVTLPVNVVST